MQWSVIHAVMLHGLQMHDRLHDVDGGHGDTLASMERMLPFKSAVYDFFGFL